MPWVANKDSSITVLHVIRGLDGEPFSGSVSGLSVYLRDPEGLDRSSLASWQEPASGGFVDITFTPDKTGNWLMEVTDPAGTDEAKTAHYVQCVLSTAGLTPSGNWYTTLANLKERLGLPTADTDDDAFLENVIARATRLIEARLGRSLLTASYQEYHDGTGADVIFLNAGPIQSISALYTVTWDSDGNPQLVEMPVSTYRPANTATEESRQPGKVVALGDWTFTRARRSWRVDYTAGYDEVPYDVEEACLTLCVGMTNVRKDVGTTGRDVGSGMLSFRALTDIWQDVDALLLPYYPVRGEA